MDNVSLGTLVGAAGVISALCAPIIALRSLQKSIRKEKEEEAAKILQAAKEADNAAKAELEAKIHELEGKLANLKESVEKDIEHLKETYNGEIRNLGEKIEELRSDLNQQHGHLVQLLTKLIEHRD